MSAAGELLLRAPELAVLQVLETTLRASTQALTVAWPELEAEDFAAAPDPPSAQACLAGALRTQMQALHQLLRRYHTLVLMQEVWACHALSRKDSAD